MRTAPLDNEGQTEILIIIFFTLFHVVSRCFTLFHVVFAVGADRFVVEVED